MNTSTTSRFALGDTVRIVMETSRFHGVTGVVKENDRSDRVPYVVDIEGEIMGICFSEDWLELVEAAEPLAIPTSLSMELFEVYKDDGTLRFATSNKHELGNRSQSDYVVTRTWTTEGSAEVLYRDLRK